jgi:hypothetical protein
VIDKLMGDEWSDLDDNDWSIYRKVINTWSGVSHIKATCNLDALTLDVNGSTLLQVSDPDLRAGEVGLYVCAYDSPGVEVLFDNYVVSTAP